MRVYYEEDELPMAQKEVSDSESKETVSVPVYKNWFEEGKVTIPYDQAGCGACWAFSTAAATESLAFITGHLTELTEFSVQ
jgi:C1A family cysteine protease